MTKYDFAAIVFLVLSLILFVAGTYHQIYQRKMQLLCRGKLNHLGSVYFIYRKNTNNDPKELTSWRQKLQKYSPSTDFGVCPCENTTVFSYQLNLSGLFANKGEEHILFFDSHPTQKSHCKTFTEDLVAWRHLQGANFLLSNGAVVHYKKNNFPQKH
ncbi:hypothetical protein [Candidatus Uabimicrobium amorphum]|uniref:Uncharacterized protein n=1 Tax=Uabimicrobium amorphum TaxID=2596890 RepID=A0A5S9ITQ4_UABAM|nr:hypothetical protein [Candidatus Uabimicrobium amorphum]BBM87929.1 hypothetical protein UABAM_06344 [Candidatus Uabimicrobium amorphum]